MSYLVYFDDISGENCETRENEKIEYLSHPPVIGDRVSLGSERLWTVVGVDSYHHSENSEDRVYLAHCTIDPKQIEAIDRAHWFRITAYQNREPNLQLFLSDEGILLQVNENFTGSQPEVGYLLPQYNVKEHTVTSQPWGIASLKTYLPNPEIDLVCHKAIHICQCVYVPEAVPSEQSVESAIA